jgi:SAM-dependent methyltransferase
MSQCKQNDVFLKYAEYYDLLYREKDYTAEANYVARTLRGFDPHVRKILELGSGTGRHGRLLAEQGFDVTGIERSEEMVAEAKRLTRDCRFTSGGSFDCLRGDIRGADLNLTFDAVTALFHVISYQTENEDLLRTFKCAARHVRSGGLFMFDVWHGPAVLSQRPMVRVKRVENDSTRLIRIAEPELNANKSTVTVHYTMLADSKMQASLVRFGEDHRMRYLFPTEIDLLARQTGFAIERSEEFLTGGEPSEDTWGVTHILRKLRDE